MSGGSSPFKLASSNTDLGKIINQCPEINPSQSKLKSTAKFIQAGENPTYLLYNIHAPHINKKKKNRKKLTRKKKPFICGRLTTNFLHECLNLNLAKMHLNGSIAATAASFGDYCGELCRFGSHSASAMGSIQFPICVCESYKAGSTKL